MFHFFYQTQYRVVSIDYKIFIVVQNNYLLLITEIQVINYVISIAVLNFWCDNVISFPIKIL